ncbi:MAG: OmpA family protein [bacterium]|nr:OmpA family protein [bacterium]
MNVKHVLSLVFIVIATVASAQNSNVLKARTAYMSAAFAEAQELGEKAYKSISSKDTRRNLRLKGEMATLTADCYRYQEMYRPANEWYERAILLEYYSHEPEVYLYNGDMLRMMGENEKAKEMYEEYMKLVPESDLAKAGMESIKMNETFVENKTRHVIENEVELNTESFDMAAAVGDRKGVKIYFGSSRDGGVGGEESARTGDAQMDLWVSELDKKGNWTKPYLVQEDDEGTINTPDAEGTVCFDDRYKKMFFTRCPVMKKQNLGCEIWMSEAANKTEWKEPVQLTDLKPDDSVSIGHPATIDGKFLIFVSDQAGGFGGKDLWYSEYDRKSETWSAPKNMGPEINTAGDELFPTFAMNGDLMFSTDGRPGMGGLDLFRASRVGEENKWENPTNMGTPLNSKSNDYALIEIDDRNGYFTSERKSVNGEYNVDIFSYNIPPFLYSLKMDIHEFGDPSRKIEDVRITVVGENPGERWEGYSNAQGAIFWDIRPIEDETFGNRYINENSTYTISIAGDPEKYYEQPETQTITTEGLDYPQDFVVAMNLIPQRPIRLPEVRYPLNKWELLIDSTGAKPFNSKDSLLYVYKMLEDNPKLVIQLNSHTDSRGSSARNEKLATNRARRCYKFLVEEKGVDPRRIVPVGKGESSPRKVWKKGDEYYVVEPQENDPEKDQYEEIILTEKYINQYMRSNKELYERLHQYNRRTDAEILSLDFDPETAPPADEKYLNYVPYR